VQPFKNYLFPLSEGQNITDQIHDLLGRINESDTIVHLVSVASEPDSLFTSISDINLAELQRHSHLTITSYLESVRESLSESYKNIQFPSLTLKGKPFIALIEYAEHHDIDCIVVDSHYQSVNPSEAMDSTVKHLMRKSRKPVWSISSNQPKTIRRILAAVNVIAETPEGHDLNQDIVSCASQLAASFGCELALFHAWQLYGESYLRSHMHYAESDIAEHALAEKTLRKQRIQALIQNHTNEKINTSIQLVKGHPDSTIPIFVRENSIDLVIMGTVCRSGIPGFFIGNTAETMLEALDCSIIAIKPQGFQSPVCDFRS